MRNLLILGALVSNFAFAKAELTLEQKLYNYIESTQIREHSDARYFGLWPNTIRVEGDERALDETDIFTGMHIMLMLDEVDKHMPLLGFDPMRQMFNEQFKQYRKDSVGKGGTLNFWPLRAGGFHNFSPDGAVAKITGIPDLFNDFDDSALGLLWEMADGKTASSDLLNTLADYSDSKTGAFFTWYSRSLLNTDCVVNLNILHALARYESRGGILPAQTAAARDSALNYIRNIMENNETGTCARFYNRSSQFYIALARVYDANSDYVDNWVLSQAGYGSLSVTEKFMLSVHEVLDSKNATEIAEYLVALKLFGKSAKKYNLEPYFDTLNDKLTKNLRDLIQETPDTAFLPGDSVFLGISSKGEWTGKELHWYSPAQSTATALLALTLP